MNRRAWFAAIAAFAGLFRRKPEVVKVYAVNSDLIRHVFAVDYALADGMRRIAYVPATARWNMGGGSMKVVLTAKVLRRFTAPAPTDARSERRRVTASA